MAEYTKRRSGSLSSYTAQEQRKRESQERKRSILYLILGYLKECNLKTSYDALKTEAQLNDQFTVCDNVDLDIILQEYQSYYNMKFQKEPQIIRRTSLDEKATLGSSSQKNLSASRLRTPEQKEKEIERTKSSKRKEDDFQFEIISIESQERIPTAGGRRRSSQISEQEKKHLSDFSGYTPEWREMADLIMRDIVPNTLGFSWHDCIGLEKPIELLKEATIYPLVYPDLFKNLMQSWTGVLLYGPPGTGKTLLAKALACEIDATFINVTSSSFVSKWRGDSEKMIKVMFDLAKYYAPTTIFIDEIDALLSETKDTNHEASCRFKSELLVQMDGLLSSNESVFLLATTNHPWKLDKALLRRFEKRILIPLPNEDAKIRMLKHYANLKSENKNDWNNLMQLTENFSGSDLKSACKEMGMSLVREQLRSLSKTKKIGAPRNATIEDLTTALKSVKPTVNMDYYNKLSEWNQEYGSR
ncbi:katanin p60 ATPase-containing subunit A-like 2 [Coccinella septempunctata]|uniref:katanin p60 ATPase-containing subunit A-like 2 n=1 Tax=Coccinella septempunctata TaxID=41139 RepID=UPI001D083954|nr:katanin p60 ATPase-containing subunit A-like 2 [Coccinella septempunctata]